MKKINTLALVGLVLLGSSSLFAADIEIEGGQTDAMQFMGSLLFWEAVSFILLLLVMSKVVFPKMFSALKNRQTHIEEALAKADRVNKEAEELLAKHEKMLAESHAEAKRITDEAIAKGEKAREEMIAAAKKDADNVVKHAKAEIRRTQDAAMEEIRNQAVELSLLASSQLLERSLSDDDHRRLADQAVENAVASFSRN